MSIMLADSFLSITLPAGSIATLVAASGASIIANVLNVASDAIEEKFSTTTTHIIGPYTAEKIINISTVAGGAEITLSEFTNRDAHLPVIKEYTGDHTLALIDANNIVSMNKSTGVNLTVDTAVNVNFKVGDSIRVIQKGAGTVTLVAAEGVTINKHSSLVLTTLGQWAMVELQKIDTNIWLVSGQLGAA
jgi:hypothetical protein